MNVKGIISGTAVRRGATAVVALAAAVGALGACSAEQTGGTAQANPTAGAGAGLGAAPVNTPDTVPADPAADAAEAADAPDAPQGSAGGQGAAMDAKGTRGHGGFKTPECKKLKVSTSQPRKLNGSDSQWQLPIMLTNQGGTACVVRGFPGVRLDGADGTSWDMRRTTEAKKPMTLAPGQHTSANLTYLVDDTPGGWKIAKMAVTPPHTYNTQILDWPVGRALVKQDGATHPGTYISPIQVR
ncbi:DUF4232 domain-containing protein [Amycolatopsis minnesotensis]|uniref:DUF4232 domain-containing protein n=1 Tax=Amycolatopsis minnesotensis TaxID=337894 RepID=A0ABN2QAC5_9PSEU